jgi:chemotaxis protein methyltransferase WspC
LVKRAAGRCWTLSEAAAICEAQLSQGQASAQVYYLLGLLRDAGVMSARRALPQSTLPRSNHYETLVHLAVLADKNGDTAAARNFQRRAERLQPGIDLSQDSSPDSICRSRSSNRGI